MENYTIHRLEQVDFDCLIPLMQDCFGMEVDISYFKWKYIDNPDGFVRGYYAKSSTNEIAAYYGVIPQMISYFGEDKLIYQSCDTMTHSKHRRKGLFQLLAKHCYSELEQENQLFIIGFGGSESTPGFLKFGWKHLFDCKNLFYPTFFKHFILKNNSYTTTECTIDNLNKIKHLIESDTKNRIHTKRTIEKYAWRLKNPLHAYKMITLAPKQQITTSFLVYYVENNTIQLIDHHFNTISEGKQLLKNILTNEKRTQYIKGILAFSQEKGSWSLPLKKIGFMSNPLSKGPLSYRTPFITLTKKEDYQTLKNCTYWNISPYDHDSL
ncbi:MAG: GNAT family N-acetyltransferase [Crocinitomicaceae bacterium]|jgi:hypothetical protein